MIPINLTGKKFGRLTVISYDFDSKGTGHAKWWCSCNCDSSDSGKMVSVRSSHLKTGNVKSCGCLAKEVARKLLTSYSRSDKHKGPGNPQWKGDLAKHSSIHTWLNKHYIKDKCEVCGIKNNLDWALKVNKKHSHNRNNYKILCRSHHMTYDYKHKIR